MGLNGDLMGFTGDLMGLNGDLIGLNGEFMGFHGISPRKIVISWDFSWDLMMTKNDDQNGEVHGI